MTRLEAKHRNDIRDALTVAFKLRYKAQVDKSKVIMHLFLKEMKDRRQLRLCVNNFIGKSYTIQSRVKFQKYLWGCFRSEVLYRLDKAIEVTVAHLLNKQNKEKQKDKIKTYLDFKDSLLDIK